MLNIKAVTNFSPILPTTVLNLPKINPIAYPRSLVTMSPLNNQDLITTVAFSLIIDLYYYAFEVAVPTHDNLDETI
jgi:hypothetical protein